MSVKSSISSALSFLKSLLPGKQGGGRVEINRADWRPVKPGEPGYGRRQYVPAGTVNVTSKTPRISVRQYQQAGAGKRLETRAAENASGRTQAQRDAARLKRRETEFKKNLYKREKIGDIRRFERLKERRIADNEHNQAIADDRKKGKYRRMKEGEFNWLSDMAYKHEELDPDFLSLVYPTRHKAKRKSRAGHKGHSSQGARKAA